MLRISEPTERAGSLFRPGLGVPCREAQADGFPCTGLRGDCADCDKARLGEGDASTGAREPITTATHA